VSYYKWGISLYEYFYVSKCTVLIFNKGMVTLLGMVYVSKHKLKIVLSLVWYVNLWTYQWMERLGNFIKKAVV